MTYMTDCVFKRKHCWQMFYESCMKIPHLFDRRRLKNYKIIAYLRKGRFNLSGNVQINFQDFKYMDVPSSEGTT